MKHTKLPQFTADWARLSPEEQAKFWQFLKVNFLPALAEYERNPVAYRWPASLRFERLTNTCGCRGPRPAASDHTGRSCRPPTPPSPTASASGCAATA